MLTLSAVVLPTLAVFASAAPWTPPRQPVAADTACIAMFTDRMPLDTRASPLDSASFRLDGGTVKLCYGRPSARGRTMIGGRSVPYGSLWRTGANEPTMIHTTVSLSVAGVRVPAGSYSLYTVPAETEWEVIVNRSITQWGHESRYTDEIRAQEVGRGRVPSESLAEHVETFTIRAEARDGAAELVLEWEHTRVRIPIARG